MPCMSALPHIPALRFGRPYESLDTSEVRDHATGQTLAVLSQVNAAMVRKDLSLAAAGRAALRAIPADRMLEACRRAAELFLTADLPLGAGLQSFEDYIRQLSATSGLPHRLARLNSEKIALVFREMDRVLNGLTRGLSLDDIDSGRARQAGSTVSYFAETDCLGVVLPSNSPGVNSIYLPAVPLRIPVLLKPGREEPLTPWRIIQSFIAAGLPPAAFGFYPTSHEGAEAILTGCRRGIIFGDDSTLARYASNHAIEKHGTGRSKVLLGDDAADRWQDALDVIVESVAANSGRSCINASTLVVPRHAVEIADALARRLAAIAPLPPDHPDAALSAFANPGFAEMIDAKIQQGLEAGDAVDVSAGLPGAGPRLLRTEHGCFLRPTVILCNSATHPLANTEFLFPFVAVVEMPQEQMLDWIGPSLVVSVVTNDPGFTRAALDCRSINRLNLGCLPTNRIDWDQPHEGNLFEFLYRRRALMVPA